RGGETAPFRGSIRESLGETTPAGLCTFRHVNDMQVAMALRLWQVGADYLDYCDSNRELLELYLERIPMKTEAEARKIIYLAKKRNLENLVKTISNVMTSKALSNGKLGTALTWVMHSRDVRFADEIADRWLKDYSKYQKVEGLEIFKNMGSCMLVSDKLTFV
ncbi:Nuclear pore complex protein Nup85, partial [Araneus ventricosus]